MKLDGNTILITGGGTGIGLALAEAFLKKGSQVLACGRREEKLKEAMGRLPALKTMACDITREEDRRRLAEWAIASRVNVLVNNAGVQREVNFKHGLGPLEEGDNEIRCNLEGPVYLTALLAPHLMIQEGAAIVNVSSGLGFMPLSIMPLYCATKAAIHSFTVSLRYQLSHAGVKVFEVIPPTVDTELDRGARAKRGQKDLGIPASQVAAEVLKGLSEDKFEIPVGQAGGLMAASRGNFEEAFQRMNGHFKF
jgi:uncharacterized oxidoreductase